MKVAVIAGTPVDSRMGVDFYTNFVKSLSQTSRFVKAFQADETGEIHEVSQNAQTAITSRANLFHGTNGTNLKNKNGESRSNKFDTNADGDDSIDDEAEAETEAQMSENQNTRTRKNTKTTNTAICDKFNTFKHQKRKDVEMGEMGEASEAENTKWSEKENAKGSEKEKERLQKLKEVEEALKVAQNIEAKREPTHKADFEFYQISISEDCDKQCIFQQLSQSAKLRVLNKLFTRVMLEEKINNFIVYCNSLSGAFDFESFTKLRPHILCVTPLDIYKNIAHKFKNFGVISANNIALAGIEKTILNANKNASVFGVSNMNLVRQIEAGVSQKAIMQNTQMNALREYFLANECEAIVLGCTHFPYLKKQLEMLFELPLIDPAACMFEALLSKIEKRKS